MEENWTNVSGVPSSMDTIRSVLAEAGRLGHPAQSADCVAAYTQADLPKGMNVCIVIPRELWSQDMIDQAKKIVGKGGESYDGEYFWRLRKPLYGLKIAGRTWMSHLASILAKLKWVPVPGHPQTWTRRGETLTCYVDDLVLASARCSQTWKELRAHIELTEPEEVKRVLGVSVNYVRSKAVDGSAAFDVRFSMRDYIDKLVDRYFSLVKTTGRASVTTPSRGGVPTSAELDTPGTFAPHAASVVMAAMYAARMCRPDTLCTINHLSSFLSKWNSYADKALLSLMNYLRCTSSYELCGTVKIGDKVRLLGYADADLASGITHSRSTSGGILFLASEKGEPTCTFFPLMWGSKRQTCTSSSTAESELVSLSRFVRESLMPAELVWNQVLEREVASTVMEDNSAAISVVDSGYSSTLRFLARHHRIAIGFLTEAFDEPTRELLHIESRYQRADGFTKLLEGPRHQECNALLGVVPPGAALPRSFYYIFGPKDVDGVKGKE
jgi:hypothetical protein